MRHWLVPCALLLALAVPATAQQSEEGAAMTAAECRSLFQESDTNGDGILSQQEIAAAEMSDVPAGIGVSAFEAECAGS